MELACASIPRLHMSNPAPSLNFTAPWCWCRCWQPQAPSQAPSSTALPTLPTDRHPKPHLDTPTARSCLLPGPPPPAQTSQASREQPLAMHGGNLSIRAPSRAAPGSPHGHKPRAALPHHAEQPLQSRGPAARFALQRGCGTRRGHGAS